MLKIHNYLFIALLIMVMSIMACTSPQRHPVLQWNKYAVLPGAAGRASLGYAGPLTGIVDGRLLVGGGANFPQGMPWKGGKKIYYSDAWLTPVDRAQPVFTKISLPYKVAYGASCTTPTGIVCAGGENEQGLLSDVLLIRISNNLPVYTKLPPLPEPLTNAAATTAGNRIYIAGGETTTDASCRFLTLDLDDTAGGWRTLADIPHKVSHTVLLSTNSEKIFLAGGRKKTAEGISERYNNLFEYNVATDSWTEKSPLPYALNAGSGTVLSDGNLLLFGGDKGVVFHKTEELIRAIRLEQDSARKKILLKEKAALQAGHPGFSKEILHYDVKKDTWSVEGYIPFPVPVTTTAVRNGSKVWIPSGEIKAGIRTPQILEVVID